MLELTRRRSNTSGNPSSQSMGCTYFVDGVVGSTQTATQPTITGQRRAVHKRNFPPKPCPPSTSRHPLSNLRVGGSVAKLNEMDDVKCFELEIGIRNYDGSVPIRFLENKGDGSIWDGGSSNNIARSDEPRMICKRLLLTRSRPV